MRKLLVAAARRPPSPARPPRQALAATKSVKVGDNYFVRDERRADGHA